eukprot:TRINITY_DN3823_c0_g1_i1.p1 TRINITY_DN3823_c0_g1~~TRINITY_DN3823_c0_g1_i1.p1  ORF type:complete len:373 (-),score=92.55 TRINITY_DN3823_c0_g1_i1:386-1504(-)
MASHRINVTSDKKSDGLSLSDGVDPSSPNAKAPQLAGVVLDKRTVRLMSCVVGIIGSLMLYGILQERIMTTPYGDENPERFRYSVFLVLNNRMAACLVAAAILVFTRESLKNVAPLYKYFMISLSNVTATTCQYEALKFVNFPTQTLGKCAKMIPVMIWGHFIDSKKYSMDDYAVAGCVTLGSTLFLLTGDPTEGSGEGDQSTSIYGLLLMLGYLGFDGFTSTFQSKLFSNYSMSTYNQMMYVNLCSGIISLMGLLFSGQLWDAIAFIIRHPDMLNDALILSFSAVAGQFCITYTIKEFGALVYATVMTTRQFLSIFISCIFFVHPLSFWQWIGTIMIFGALYFQGFSKPAHGKHGSKASKPAQLTTEKQGP